MLKMSPQIYGILIKKKLDQNSLNNEITSNKNSVAQENSLNDIFKNETKKNNETIKLRNRS